ncbi:hypothetical protein Vretimale_16994, partial [Volvox reticuliferus]
MSASNCMRALSDTSPYVADIGLRSPDDPKSSQRHPRPCHDEPSPFRSFLSHGSSFSDALEGLSLMPSRLNSVGDEAPSPIPAGEEGPELNVDSVHEFIGSPRYHMAGGVPRPKILAHISGTGLAPWEIHRPQKFVRDLILRRCFSGRVLDAGCGIGDNALYVAKAAPGTNVTAVDVVGARARVCVCVCMCVYVCVCVCVYVCMYVYMYVYMCL